MFLKFTHISVNLTLCTEIIQYNIQINYQFIRKRFDLKVKIYQYQNFTNNMHCRKKIIFKNFF